VPAARARIVGRDPTPRLRDRHGGAVQITGTVPDVLPHLRAAGVLVLPLRSGGGTRLKVLEAMAAGVPVVSTPLGVEGLAVRDGEHVLIGRSAADLAELAARVLRDRALAVALSRAGRALVERTYDWAVVARPLIELHHRLAESP
jgi:glycosyltransferase involved in cell wall biosynthesis